MAYTGYRYPRYCKIDIEEDGTETLQPGRVMGKGIRAEITVDTSEAILYADDGPAESVREFSGGSISQETDDLENQVLADLTGAALSEDGELTANDADVPPFLRVGFLSRKVKNNKVSYKGTVYMKVQYGVPGESYETKGQNTTFKTPTIAGRIYRNENGDWKKQKEFPTVAAALAYVDELVNIKQQEGV